MIQKGAIKPVKHWKVMPRGVAQSIGKSKSDLRAVPALGRRRPPFKSEQSHALHFCAHSEETTAKAKVREQREGGGSLRRIEKKASGQLCPTHF